MKDKIQKENENGGVEELKRSYQKREWKEENIEKRMDFCRYEEEREKD